MVIVQVMLYMLCIWAGPLPCAGIYVYGSLYGLSVWVRLHGEGTQLH